MDFFITHLQGNALGFLGSHAAGTHQYQRPFFVGHGFGKFSSDIFHRYMASTDQIVGVSPGAPMACNAGSNNAVPEITATDTNIQLSIKKFTR